MATGGPGWGVYSTASDHRPGPIAFVARTRNRYCCPATRSPTVHEVASVTTNSWYQQVVPGPCSSVPRDP
eukprot:2196990-Rhodomonas_salina.3